MYVEDFRTGIKCRLVNPNAVVVRGTRLYIGNINAMHSANVHCFDGVSSALSPDFFRFLLWKRAESLKCFNIFLH